MSSDSILNSIADMGNPTKLAVTLATMKALSKSEEERRMTRYIEAFSWPNSAQSPIQDFLEKIVTEKPLLHACSGKSRWGDVKVDKFMPADLNVDWTELPYADDSFGAVFADPPWNWTYRKQCAVFIKRALRIAPVVYLMAPWIWGTSEAKLTAAWFRQMPGINPIVAITRYERTVDEVRKREE